MADRAHPELTRTERRVLPLMALRLKIAAGRLGLHEKTVQFHQRNIARKFGADDRFGAVVLATRAGWDIEIQPLRGTSPESEDRKSVV